MHHVTGCTFGTRILCTLRVLIFLSFFPLLQRSSLGLSGSSCALAVLWMPRMELHLLVCYWWIMLATEIITFFWGLNCYPTCFSSPRFYLKRIWRIQLWCRGIWRSWVSYCSTKSSSWRGRLWSDLIRNKPKPNSGPASNDWLHRAEGQIVFDL